jgi:hypothetical protein
VDSQWLFVIWKNLIIRVKMNKEQLQVLLMESLVGLKQFNPIGRAIKSANCKPVELLCLFAITRKVGLIKNKSKNE